MAGKMNPVVIGQTGDCGGTGSRWPDELVISRTGRKVPSELIRLSGHVRQRGHVLQKLGRLDEAEREWREARGIFDDLGESENHGWVLDGLGDVLRGLGRDEEAVAAYERAIAVLGMTADRRTQAWATFSLASIWWDLRDYERAAPGFARAARLAWDANLNALCGVAWRLRALTILHLGWQRIRGRAQRLAHVR